MGDFKESQTTLLSTSSAATAQNERDVSHRPRDIVGEMTEGSVTSPSVLV